MLEECFEYGRFKRLTVYRWCAHRAQGITRLQIICCCCAKIPPLGCRRLHTALCAFLGCLMDLSVDLAVNSRCEALVKLLPVDFKLEAACSRTVWLLVESAWILVELQASLACHTASCPALPSLIDGSLQVLSLGKKLKRT